MGYCGENNPSVTASLCHLPLRAIPPCGALAFRSAFWLRQTLELQSLRDLRQTQTLEL